MNCLKHPSKMTQICRRLSQGLLTRQTSRHQWSTSKQRSKSYVACSRRSALPVKVEPMLSNCSLVKENLLTQYICQTRGHSGSAEQRDDVTNNKHVDKCSWHVLDEGKILELRHRHGKIQRFHSTWLRYNCQCSSCVEPDSGQRTVEPSQLEPRYTIKRVDVSDDDGYEAMLSWHEDDHVSRFTSSYLDRHGYSGDERRQMYADRIPSVSKGAVPTFGYEQMSAGERSCWTWLAALNEFGLTLIKDVPAEEGMVLKICEKISNVMPTIYGQIFDVVSTEHPINIAYSSVNLGFHIDLAYYESPPGIQLLHCLRFDDCVRGGETVTVDAWYVAEQLRKEHPEQFTVLTRVPATFQKHHFNRENPVYMTYQRPHIVVGHTGQITNINWSPPFEGPLCVSEEDVEPYYEAYHTFAAMLENSDTKVAFRMETGDVLAFNNRRILHSRRGFELNGGQRHLQGCYVNIDEFKSKVQVLSMKYNNGRPAKDVFNQSVL